MRSRRTGDVRVGRKTEAAERIECRGVAQRAKLDGETSECQSTRTRLFLYLITSTLAYRVRLDIPLKRAHGRLAPALEAGAVAPLEAVGSFENTSPCNSLASLLVNAHGQRAALSLAFNSTAHLDSCGANKQKNPKRETAAGRQKKSARCRISLRSVNHKSQFVNNGS